MIIEDIALPDLIVKMKSLKLQKSIPQVIFYEHSDGLFRLYDEFDPAARTDNPFSQDSFTRAECSLVSVANPDLLSIVVEYEEEDQL